MESPEKVAVHKQLITFKKKTDTHTTGGESHCFLFVHIFNGFPPWTEVVGRLWCTLQPGRRSQASSQTNMHKSCKISSTVNNSGSPFYLLWRSTDRSDTVVSPRWFPWDEIDVGCISELNRWECLLLVERFILEKPARLRLYRKLLACFTFPSSIWAA